jgi:hypothetical protein
VADIRERQTEVVLPTGAGDITASRVVVRRAADTSRPSRPRYPSMASVGTAFGPSGPAHRPRWSGVRRETAIEDQGPGRSCS